MRSRICSRCFCIYRSLSKPIFIGEKQGAKIVLGLGYSHPVVFEEKDGVKFDIPDATTIIVKGINKQAVGQVAAVIRSKRPPEPYLGKGIKYTGEKIRRKAGTTGK